MVEPDSAEPIWKTTRSVFSGRPSSHPSRRQSDAGVGAAGVGADRGVDQVAAVVLGGPISVFRTVAETPPHHSRGPPPPRPRHRLLRMSP